MPVFFAGAILVPPVVSLTAVSRAQAARLGT